MIRQFEPQDAEACSALSRACLRMDPMIAPDAREDLLRLETAAAMRERACLYYLAVCFHSGGIVGAAGVDMNEIRLLFVDPGQRRKGIGTSLLEHVEALVPAALFEDIFVYASPAAVGFYLSRGYLQGGDCRIAIGEYTFKTVFMSKRIRAGRQTGAARGARGMMP